MLLNSRSILIQACFLASVLVSNGQNYEAEAEAEHPEYSESYHPDYSKYYSVDSVPQSSPQVASGSESGFVTPIDFTTFFGTPHYAFGASKNQQIIKPLGEFKQSENLNGLVSDKEYKGGFSEYDSDGFGAQDYFEQAQKQQQKAPEASEKEEEEENPGPSYVSHKIPVKKISHESEAEVIKKVPSKYNKARNQDPEPVERDEDRNEYEFKPSTPVEYTQFRPINQGNVLEEEGNQKFYPFSPEYYKKYTDTKPTPYQKYSFQPAASTYALTEEDILKSLQLASAPYNPTYAKLASNNQPNYEYQPTQVYPQSLKENCVKVDKESTSKSVQIPNKAMQCYVCKNSKSGEKYERCSYTREPNPKAYFASTSKSYRNPEKYRTKREESESYIDPYEAIKAGSSHAYHSKPKDFEEQYYKSPDFSKYNDDYSFNPENLHDKEAEDKSYSEVKSQQLLSDPKNCQKSTKKGMTCTVCKDPESGANYEQCSYTSEPTENKYAYVKERKYDGDESPIKKETYVENGKKKKYKKKDYEDEPEETKVVERYNKDDIPSHFEDAVYEQRRAGVRGLDPELYGQADSSEKSEEIRKQPEHHDKLDDYYAKLFPEHADQESRRKEVKTKSEYPFYHEEYEKKGVEQVLEEFAKKDRSNCEKINKKGLTCYLCVDAKGIQQEECMYVSESRPVKSHVAYHQKEHSRKPKNEKRRKDEEDEEESIKETKKSSKYKKPPKVTVEESRQASTNIKTNLKFTPSHAERANVRNKRSPKHSKSKGPEKDPEPVFDINDEGGLYSAETNPVYSKTLGFSLPRYMLEKTDTEIEFDKSVSGG